jgi:hypothetical protein
MKHSEIINAIRTKGSENYFALATLNDHELLNAFKNPQNTGDENCAIREEILSRMTNH